MQLSYNGLKETAGWEKAGIALPSYDPASVAEKTGKDPVWVHFGIGNIFRIFIGGIADTLLRSGEMDRGIICAETFDDEVVDRIYDPFDNLVMAVTLHGDGRTEQRVLGSLSEAVKAASEQGRERLREIFRSAGLQMVTFTITEKGYAMRGADGDYLPYVKKDLEQEATLSLMTRVLGRIEAEPDYVPGETPLVFVGADQTLYPQIYGFEAYYDITGAEYPSAVPYSECFYYYNAYKAYFRYVLNTRAKMADTASWRALQSDERVQAMPAYPAQGCLKDVDGVLVVKLGEPIDWSAKQ